MWYKYVTRRIKSLSRFGLHNGEKLLYLNKRNRWMAEKQQKNFIWFGNSAGDFLSLPQIWVVIIVCRILDIHQE